MMLKQSSVPSGMAGVSSSTTTGVTRVNPSARRASSTACPETSDTSRSEPGPPISRAIFVSFVNVFMVCKGEIRTAVRGRR